MKTKAFLLSVFLSAGVGKLSDAHASPEEQPSQVSNLVSGRVVDDNGDPVEGATVGITLYHEPGGGGLITGRLDRPLTTNAEGFFEFLSLEPGAVDIAVEKTGYFLATARQVPVGTTGIQLVVGPGASISGKVIDEKQTPVQDAVVRLIDGDRDYSAADRVMYDFIKTDPGGIWRIPDLPPGIYGVYASKDGNRTNVAERIRVSGGQDVDGIELVLPERGVTVSGRVLEKESRDPLPDLTVSLWHEPSGTGVARKAGTDAEGRFELENVPPGDYRLTVREPRAPNQPESYSREDLKLSVADSDVEDLVLELEPLAVLAGRVLLPSGEPAAGAGVSLRGRFLTYVPDATADDEGSFEVPSIPPGVEFQARASLEGYAPVASPSITLGPREYKDDVELVLRLGESVSGRIQYEDGEPVTEGYSVSARSVDFVLYYGQARPDASGHYEIDDIVPGQTLLMLDQDEPGRPFGREIYSKRKKITVKAGKSLTGVDFVVSRTGELPGFIAGRITDPDGKGVGGVRVTAYAIKKPWEDADEPGELGSATTDKDGNFRIENLREGRFGILLHPGTHPLPFVTEREERIEVDSPTEDLAVVLQPYVSVSGRVVEKGSGRSVPSFQVRLMGYYHQQFPMETINNPEGRFRLDRVAPLPATLWVRVEGVSTVHLPLEFPGAGDITDLLVEMPGKTGIEGKVIAQRDAKPVADAKVNVYRRDATAVADTKGRFSLAGLRAGVHKVVVEHPDYGWTLAPAIEVPEGRVVSGTVIELATPGGIEGRVFDPQGNPAEGTIVLLDLPTGSGDTRKTQADANGFYEFPKLSPGEYRIQLRSRASAANVGPTKWVLLRSGETKAVDFGGLGGVVRGVVSRAGEPVADAEVRLIKGAQRTVGCTSLYQMTGQDGAFHFTGLEPGPHQLVLMGPFPTSVLAIEEIEVASDELRLDLDYPSGSISGKVVRAGSGEPVRNAEVKAIRQDLDRRYLGTWVSDYFLGGTDREGTFQIDSLPPGDYLVQVSSPPLAWKIHKVSLQKSERVEEIGFALEEGGELIITLVDAESGKPIDGSVTLFDDSGRKVGRHSADHRHEIQIDGMPRGNYRAMASPTWYGSYTYGPSFHPVTMQGGFPVLYQLRCPRACRVKVLLEDSAGEPISGVHLRILDASGENRAAPPYNPSFAFPWNTYHLQPGSYEVSVEKDGFKPLKETILVRTGKPEVSKTLILQAVDEKAQEDEKR